ncbi:MAG: hypothetical protein JO019_00825 [Candidatus Kaiserbacteria bacterium]|nr:hypothetical protein [Candidatus Kaiserbacteria bacterium]
MVKQTTYRNVMIAALAALVILIGIAVYLHGDAFGSGDAKARETVTTFGAQLQMVSLMAPDASSTIASVYGPYVTPELLAAWEKNPSKAPGRETSSPWPDRIEITQVAPQGSGYIVHGEMVMMTSNEIEHGGDAGRVPVVLQVVPQDNSWRIAAFQEIATSTKR